ncbi:MAG: hypothetical protein ACR2H3_03175 [Acidimicrobiales bacterium]
MPARLRPLLLALLSALVAVAGVSVLSPRLGMDPSVSDPSATVSPATAPAAAPSASSASSAAGAHTPSPEMTVLGAPPLPSRVTAATGFSPFATVDSVTLVHPAAVVERVAFHQSNHEGAREMVATASAAQVTMLESRGRLSALTSSADIVVEPGGEIRAPVTGRVLRAGSYVLYCKTTDDYVVIEPEGRPGWEVKILHVQREQVSPGQQVVAGVTPIAAHATVLPFVSQVDKLRVEDPAWPHVHIEVIDPSIPNVPNGGSGSSC